MGDLNSVDLSQVCHEGMLQSNGGLSPRHHLDMADLCRNQIRCKVCASTFI